MFWVGMGCNCVFLLCVMLIRCMCMYWYLFCFVMYECVLVLFVIGMRLYFCNVFLMYFFVYE